MFYVLAAIVLAFLALETFTLIKLLARADRSEAAVVEVAKIRGELGDSKLELERKTFELDKATAVIASERVRIDALEEYVSSKAFETNPNADLDPADDAGRLLRLSRKLGAVAAEAHPGSPVPAVAAGEVRDAPGAEVVHGAGADDLLKPE